MGCCLGRSGASDSDDMENAITIGKNRPLIQERIKWKSDVPMTDGQLRSKRDEFWETAPAFEGRKEIWDALRAASALAEQGDYALSQAILDGANISLPDGTLRESYDELGNRYQVPYYCLSAPTNMVEERSSESSGATGNGDGPHSSVISSSDRPGSSNPTGSSSGELQTLKLRLSTTGEDVSVDCHTKETVHVVKQRLHQTTPDTIPPANQQRWFYGGRILLDKMRIGDCRIPQNFVVQVVLNNNNSTNNGKSLNHDQKSIDHQPRLASDQTSSSIDTTVVILSKDSVQTIGADETSKSITEMVRPKDQPNMSSPSLPGSALEQIGRRAGSASSRKSRKLRPHHSASGSATNGTNSVAGQQQTVVQQQRCNSFHSKRSADSPTPVETS